jgi:hypothetical protein
LPPRPKATLYERLDQFATTMANDLLSLDLSRISYFFREEQSDEALSISIYYPDTHWMRS